MGHVVVRRVALALSGLLALAALGFGWLAARPEGREPRGVASADGQALFARHCAACHREDALRPTLRAGAAPGAARRALLELLATHGAASAAEDRAIAGYLLPDGGG